MIRELVRLGDPVLVSKAAPVMVYDEKLQRLVIDLHETLEKLGGWGVAAPQIGVGQRVAVVRFNPDNRIALINPRIAGSGQKVIGLEKCFSLPGIELRIKRYLNLHLWAENERGEAYQLDLTGMPARVIQHEVDHLDGILITRRCTMK